MLLFDDVTRDGRLWSVRYEEESDNALFTVFSQWNDVEWLREFFYQNKDVLTRYFKMTDVNEAIYDTIEESDILQCMILDLSPDADLEQLFRPLNNNQAAALLLDKEKAKLKTRGRHSSWLRLYAIRLEKGVFIITGGAIKLTASMAERSHTLQELLKMEKVRNFLLEEGIVDKQSFSDYQNSL